MSYTNPRAWTGVSQSTNKPHPAAFIVYINGIEVPAKSVAQRYGVWQIPEMQIEMVADPVLTRLGAEDRVQVAVFYLDDVQPAPSVKPQFRLFGEGEIVSWGYQNTPGGRSIVFTVANQFVVLRQLLVQFLTQVDDYASNAVQLNPSLIGVATSEILFPFSLFTDGLLRSTPATVAAQKSAAEGGDNFTSVEQGAQEDAARAGELFTSIEQGAAEDAAQVAAARELRGLIPVIKKNFLKTAKAAGLTPVEAEAAFEKAMASSAAPEAFDISQSGRTHTSVSGGGPTQGEITGGNPRIVADDETFLQWIKDTLDVSVKTAQAAAAGKQYDADAADKAAAQQAAATAATSVASKHMPNQIRRPFDYLYNVVKSMLEKKIPSAVRTVPASNFFARWARLTNFQNRFVAFPYFDDANDNNVFPVLKALQSVNALDVLVRKLLPQMQNAGSLFDMLQLVYQTVFMEIAMIPLMPLVQTDLVTGVIEQTPFEEHVLIQDPKNSTRFVPKKAPVPLKPNRIANYFSKPQLLFSIPPSCNVIFPSQIKMLSYQENFHEQPTRLYFNDSTVTNLLQAQGINNVMISNALATGYPPEVDVNNQLRVQGANVNGKNFLLYPEEFFRGPVMDRREIPPWLFFLRQYQDSVQNPSPPGATPDGTPTVPGGTSVSGQNTAAVTQPVVERAVGPVFQNPVPGSRLSSVWGDDRSYLNSKHYGVDFRAPGGTPVYASIGGVVTRVVDNNNTTEGKHVYIKTSNIDTGTGRSNRGQITTRYLHLNSISVQVGAIVLAGALIGTVGNTYGPVVGGSPPHLHYDTFGNQSMINFYTSRYGVPRGGFPARRSLGVQFPVEPFIGVKFLSSSVRDRLQGRGVPINPGSLRPNDNAPASTAVARPIVSPPLTATSGDPPQLDMDLYRRLKAGEENVYQLYAKYEYYRERYATRSGTAHLSWNPYVVPGFPAAFFDQRTTRVDVFAYITTVQHRMSHRERATDITFVYGRTIQEVFGLLRHEFDGGSYKLGNAPQEPVKDVRKVGQDFSRAELMYRRLFHGGRHLYNKDASFDWRKIIGFAPDSPAGLPEPIYVAGQDSDSNDAYDAAAQVILAQQPRIQDLKKERAVAQRKWDAAAEVLEELEALEASSVADVYSTATEAVRPYRQAQAEKDIDEANATIYAVNRDLAQLTSQMEESVDVVTQTLNEVNVVGVGVTSNVTGDREVVPLSSAEPLFQEYDAAMAYNWRPICTLDEYIIFYNSAGEGAIPAAGHERSVGARYYTRIRRLTPLTPAYKFPTGADGMTVPPDPPIDLSPTKSTTGPADQKIIAVTNLSEEELSWYADMRDLYLKAAKKAGISSVVAIASFDKAVASKGVAPFDISASGAHSDAISRTGPTAEEISGGLNISDNRLYEGMSFAQWSIDAFAVARKTAIANAAGKQYESEVTAATAALKASQSTEGMRQVPGVHSSSSSNASNRFPQTRADWDTILLAYRNNAYVVKASRG